MAEYTCPAVLSIKGEHFPCDWMDQMVPGSVGHDGWAHANREAEAIWHEDPASITAAWSDSGR